VTRCNDSIPKKTRTQQTTRGTFLSLGGERLESSGGKALIDAGKGSAAAKQWKRRGAWKRLNVVWRPEIVKLY